MKKVQHFLGFYNSFWKFCWDFLGFYNNFWKFRWDFLGFYNNFWDFFGDFLGFYKNFIRTFYVPEKNSKYTLQLYDEKNSSLFKHMKSITRFLKNSDTWKPINL